MLPFGPTVFARLAPLRPAESLGFRSRVTNPVDRGPTGNVCRAMTELDSGAFLPFFERSRARVPSFPNGKARSVARVPSRYLRNRLLVIGGLKEKRAFLYPEILGGNGLFCALALRNLG